MFILVATNFGDELIPGSSKPVAASPDRSHLEALAASRAAERIKWETANPAFPWWSRASLIQSESIIEVPDV